MSCCANQRDLGDPALKSHDHKQRSHHQEPVLDVWHCLTPWKGGSDAYVISIKYLEVIAYIIIEKS